MMKEIGMDEGAKEKREEEGGRRRKNK